MPTFPDQRPVHVAENESDPGRAIILRRQSHLERPVRVPNVANVDDLFKRCPAEAVVDIDKETGGKSMRSCLNDAGPAGGDLAASSRPGAIDELANVQSDTLHVDSPDWIMNPGQLVWNSVLLAQLEARERALKHLEFDTYSWGLGSGLTDDQKRAMATVAREMAETLRGDFRREFQANQARGTASRQDLENATRERARHQTNLKPGDKDSKDPTAHDLNTVYGG